MAKDIATECHRISQKITEKKHGNNFSVLLCPSVALLKFLHINIAIDEHG